MPEEKEEKEEGIIGNGKDFSATFFLQCQNPCQRGSPPVFVPCQMEITASGLF